MGCVVTKPSMNSPPKGLEKLKMDNGYVKVGGFVAARRSTGQRPPQGKEYGKTLQPDSVKDSVGTTGSAGSGGGREAKSRGGREGKSVSSGGGRSDSDAENLARRFSASKSSGEDEKVDGWPKWLTDNIPGDALAGLVPKSAESYDKLDKIGQGTYSNVYKARDRDTGKIVALKKVRFDTSEPESVKFMAREIRILRKLDHPNIVKLEGLATSRMQYSLYLVFDFMVTDLSRIINRPDERLTEPQVKSYMSQLLSGLQHCHKRGILHRDIKGSNLLIDKSGMLKIADFGLANFYNSEKKRPLTSRVVTLWYRAPELLLGATDYGPGIDLWSAGCLLAEMFAGRPIMPGRTEVEQLHMIFKLCGTPTEEYWKRLKVPTTFRPPHVYKPNLREVFRDHPKCSFGLLNILLALDPPDRGSAEVALENEFFHTRPLACDLSGLPMIPKLDNDPGQTKDDNRQFRKSRTRQRSQKLEHQRREQLTEIPKEEYVYLNEDSEKIKRTIPSSKESGSSTTMSSEKGIMPKETSRPLADLSTKNEAHPIATKSTKNRPPLPITTKTRSLIKYRENNDRKYRLGQVQRSISTREHRKHEPKIHHKLHGLVDD